MYDYDSLGNENTSNMLLKKNVNSILLGSSGGGLKKPYNREKDYDIHDNIVYLFIFHKLIHLYKNIVNRQLERGIMKRWSDPHLILNYRHNMYKLIIKNRQQIRPLFYKFEEGIDYCIKKYNE